jgi:hypothetical protein
LAGDNILSAPSLEYFFDRHRPQINGEGMSMSSQMLYLSNLSSALATNTSIESQDFESFGLTGSIDLHGAAVSQQRISEEPMALRSQRQAARNSIESVHPFHTFALDADRAALLGPDGSRRMFSEDLPEADGCILDTVATGLEDTLTISKDPKEKTDSA